MTQTSNDNGDPAARDVVPDTDGQGEAAMLLVESLIHGLIERSIISVEDAMDITNTAVEAKSEIAADLGDKPARLRNSLTILEAINSSLQHDAEPRRA